MRNPRPAPPLPARDGLGLERLAWVVALIAAISPLWLAFKLPLVDLPQHLYVLDVLDRLHDPTTLYDQLFQFHARWSPYLGYHVVTGALALVFPLELANRLFLTAVVAGLPLALAFLLNSLRRPSWAALLAVPFAYGDNFGWGFINTLAALPFALIAAGAFVRAIGDAGRRARWAVVVALSTLAGFAMHPVPTGFLMFALPWLLLTTSVTEDTRGGGARAWLRPRIAALTALLPLTLAGAAWVIHFVTVIRRVQIGMPHAAAGAMLSAENLEFGNRSGYLAAFPILLGDIFKDGSDQLGVLAVTAVVVVACVARLVESAPMLTPPPSVRERLRMPGLVIVAFALYLLAPLNIRGYIYYLNPRYAALAATLAVGSIPRVGPRSRRVLMLMAALAAVVTAIPLGVGFRAFDRESAPLDSIAAAMADRPRIMALMFDPSSRVIQQPVFIHAGATLARRKGGVPNYSFAGGDQFLLDYRGSPPPTMPSEWRPDLFDMDRIGHAYDHFLVRGATPDSVFGSRLGHELRVAAHAGDWWLVRRIASAANSPATTDSSHSAPAQRVTPRPSTQPSGR